MNSPTSVFNLIDEPWIHVLTTQQEPKLFSIRETFLHASKIRRISSELPTQDFAILRLLISILSRVYTQQGKLLGVSSDSPDPDEWWHTEFESKELLLDEINRYLDDNHDRFWLIHPIHPFAQVANLATNKGDHAGIDRLIADAESDYFTSRAGAKLDAATYPEAARWLLHAHAYDYSGIKPAAIGDSRAKGGKGYPIGTGAAGVGGAVVIHGSNFFETLMLNLPMKSLSELVTKSFGTVIDLPFWELPPQSASARVEGSSIPTGPIDAMTWQSRRIRLFSSQNSVTGVLVTNGDKLELRNNFTDPFFGYQYSKNLSSNAAQVHLPKKHYSERTFWRGVESLLYRHSALPEARRDKNPVKLPANVEYLSRLSEYYAQGLPQQVDVELIGIEYGTQDSVISDIVHAEIPLNLRLLTAQGNAWSDVIIQNIRVTLDAASAVGSFAGMLVQAAGGEYAHNSDATREVLADLEAEFRSWLRLVAPESPNVIHVETWRRTARQTIIAYADTLVCDTGPQAFQGRFTSPKADSGQDMNPRLQSAGTARIWLLAQLNKHLPLPSQHEENPR